MRKTMLSLVLLVAVQWALANNPVVYNIETFGAVGDGKTMNTSAIQRAIDACSESGGQVYFPKGCFLTASIELKNNVEIYLDAQASLKGSPEFNDYPPGNVDRKKALIHGYRVKNVAITGRGTIDGNGRHKNFRHEDVKNGITGGLRPFVLSLMECTDIKLKEFTLIDGAFWDLELELCNQITVDDIKMYSRAVANNDGLDLVDCQNAKVSNCYFDVGDDGICLKSHSRKGVKNVVITNCIIKSESNAIKFGTAGVGGFEDVTIANCVFFDSRLSGIALELVDGGVMDRVTVNNITMHNVNGSIFVKLGSRNSAFTHTMLDKIEAKQTGVLRNIVFSNIIADGIGCWKEDSTASYFKARHDARIGMSIVGQPKHPVENITFNNISLQFAGGGTVDDARADLKDRVPAGYPEYTNLGITPAYGINCLNVKDVRFNNVKVTYIEEDARPAFCFKNAENVHIDNVQATTSQKAPAFMRFMDTKNIFITNCKPLLAVVPFASFEKGVKDVTIMNNDFRKIKGAYVKDASVDIREISVLNNLGK